MFFGPIDAHPPVALYHDPAIVSPPALVRVERSPYWLAVLAGNRVPLLGAAGLVAAPVLPQPVSGVKVELRDEGVDQNGHWFQTFRVTIQPGGTLSDAAVAIYNNPARVDDVFKAAQRDNPNLTNPAYVYAGQEIDLTIDPSQVFVFKETQSEQNGTVQKVVYYNRTVETYYNDPSLGILRTVDFPDESRAQAFNFPDSFLGQEENVQVKPGTRLVDYRYMGGDSFGDVVNKVFGVRSVKAASELLKQTGWDPNKWPPAANSQTRVLVDTLSSYEDKVPERLNFEPDNALVRQEWDQLKAEREKVGIYAVGMEVQGLVYRVMTGDGTVTTKQVSKLLFGTEEEYLTVAKAAGLELPSEDPAKVPPDYNPLLIGRDFQIQVPFVKDNAALAKQEPTAEKGQLVTRLANGTLIYDYERAEGQAGLLRLVYYPNGYKSILVRPNDLTLMVLDFVHFQVLNIASPDVPREQREELTREFQARMLWTWSRDIPRDVRDQPEQLKLNVTDSGSTLEILTRQRENISWYEAAIFEMWFTYPLVLAAVVVTLGTLVLFLVAWQARRIQASRRRSWTRRR
ncbi:MAG: hypothetical protein ACYC1C_02210 [Chloroflexota bacterium]